MTLTSRGAVTCSFPNVALHPTISSSFYPLPICFYRGKFVQGGCQQKQHCMTPQLPPPTPNTFGKVLVLIFVFIFHSSELRLKIVKHFRGTTWISPITTGSWLLATGIVSQLTVEGEAATVLCKDEGNCLTIGCTHQCNGKKTSQDMRIDWLIDWRSLMRLNTLNLQWRGRLHSHMWLDGMGLGWMGWDGMGWDGWMVIIGRR